MSHSFHGSPMVGRLLARLGCGIGTLMLLSGCGGGAGGSAGLAATAAATNLADTAASASVQSGSATTSGASLPSVFSKFNANVRVSQSGSYVVLESDGLPDHRSPYWPGSSSSYEPYNGPNPNFSPVPNATIQPHTYTFRIPIRPAEAPAKTATPLGPIGLAVNGVVIYNQYNGGGQPLTFEMDSFDQYNGHPDPMNNYHYHVEPLYVTQARGKDGLVGFLADGFPVYGPIEGGRTVTNSDLDAYHGHTGVTVDYPSGTYHYHITAEDPYINGGAYFGTPGTIVR